MQIDLFVYQLPPSTAELRSWDRSHMGHKAKILTVWLFSESVCRILLQGILKVTLAQKTPALPVPLNCRDASVISGILWIFVPSQSKGILKIKQASREFLFFPLHQASSSHVTWLSFYQQNAHDTHISQITSVLARDAAMGLIERQLTTKISQMSPWWHKNYVIFYKHFW